MWEFISSAWTPVVVPTAIAIAGVAAFVKTLLEKRNLLLQKQQLQLQISAAERRIILPSEDQIEKYGLVRVAMRRTVRLSGILLAVLLPVSVALQTGPMSSVPPPPANPVPSPPANPVPPVGRPSPSPVDPANPVPPVGRPSPSPGGPGETPVPPVGRPSPSTGGPGETPVPPVGRPSPSPGGPGETPVPPVGRPSPSPVDAAALVRETLAEYEQAAEALDYPRVRRVWPTAPDALRNSYRNLRAQSVDLDCAETDISGDAARISCKEQIRVVGAEGITFGSTNTATFYLRRNGDAWEIARISRQPR